MSEVLKNTSDEHHCRCFRINTSDIETCKIRLKELGFEQQPGGEEDHGQVFGLRFRFKKLLQIHWKVMSNGIIESEMEPPPEHPGAHLNQIHSFPPHEDVQVLLNKMNLQYNTIHPIPRTCVEPNIVEPNNPLKWWEILALGLAGAAAAFIILKATKS